MALFSSNYVRRRDESLTRLAPKTGLYSQAGLNVEESRVGEADKLQATREVGGNDNLTPNDKLLVDKQKEGGTAKLGRPRGRTAYIMRNPMIPKSLVSNETRTVDTAVAQYIDEAKGSMKDIEAKIADYRRARVVMKQGYISSTQLNVVKLAEKRATGLAIVGASNHDNQLSNTNIASFLLNGQAEGRYTDPNQAEDMMAAAAESQRLTGAQKNVSLPVGNGGDTSSQATGFGAANIAVGALPASLEREIQAWQHVAPGATKPIMAKSAVISKSARIKSIMAEGI